MSAVSPNASVTPPPKESGCGKAVLIGCGIIAVLGVIVIAVILFGVFYAVHSTDVYKNARDKAINDPRVVAALGSPVEASWWVSGNVHVDNGAGEATLNFPISGPKAKAKVHAEATIEHGDWMYQRLVVTPETGPPIDVLHP
jgi:ascorbate-specific PTS system EIIC-type component UlaA